MSPTATTLAETPRPIRWTWDFGIGLSADDSARLLALLAALHAHGTLGRAAREAGVSYRVAWGLIRRCEGELRRPLVTKARGRGTRLSDFGEQLLQLDGAARATLHDLHAPWSRRLQELLSPTAAAAPERLRIAASHDIALADWIENGRRVRVDIFWRGSEEALLALARGECDAIGFHLSSAWSGAQAAAWLGRWLKLRQFSFFPLMRRRHGLLTASGNPCAIASVADIARPGLRMVNRQRGSGTRGMIDELMAANGLRPGDIPGYGHEEFTHDAVAAAIAGGHADVGFGIEAAAARYDLGFVPLGCDLYCLAFGSGLAGSPAVNHLIERLRGTTFEQRLRALPGYELLARRCEPMAKEQFIAFVGSAGAD